MKYDIVIVGGGIVGATAALALAKNTALTILVVEANAPPVYQKKEAYDYRVSAISLAAKNIFKQLDVWEAIQAKRISLYRQMQVWDAMGQGEIHFDCAELHATALGYIIEDNVIRTSLLEKFSLYQTIHFLSSTKLVSLCVTDNAVKLITADQQVLHAQLVIAADGANSWVREQAGIELKSWDYEQTALVATVRTELMHQATARQRFLTTGPLAFLPLSDPNLCSIVWSTSHAEAKNLLALDRKEFCRVLAEAFGYRLGKIDFPLSHSHLQGNNNVFSFPLRMRHAKKYVKSSIVLIGDAAHTIHPLAGQGVNLGLLDAACLAEVVTAALEKQRHFFSLATLRRYERWRKGDTLLMLAMVEGLKHLFASKNHAIKNIRNAGLSVTNKTMFIKKFFANYALGKRGDLPKLAI